MKIKTKILISNLMMVILAVTITMASVFFFLEHGIQRQTQILLKDLRQQSFQRIKDSNRILRYFMRDYIFRFNQSLASFCIDETVKEGIHKGQWKSVFGKAEAFCKTNGVDFLVFLDARGMVHVSWPNIIDSEYPEMHFKRLELYKKFDKYIEREDLVNIPVFSSIDKWTRKVLRGYGVGIDDDMGIVTLSASVIPNEYFDEPLGYILIGISGSGSLSEPLRDFFETTGQMALLTDGDSPLVWAGFPEEKNNFKKSPQSFGIHRFLNSPSDVSDHVLIHNGDEYHILARKLEDLSSPTIIVTEDASSTLIISGEPAKINIETSEKIRWEGEETRNRLMEMMSLSVLLVLIMTVAIVNFVGRKISRPIEIAAEISDKIASGSLDHALDESSSDETGTLSRAMNKMIRNLKHLKEKNKLQLKALEDSKHKSESILAAIQEGVILVDANTHRIIDVNPAALSMINAERNDIIGTIYHDYFNPDEKESRLGSQIAPSGSYANQTLRTKGGNRISILRNAVPITLEGRECLLENFIDITPLKKTQEERLRLESQLQQAKKMEAIGLLAGGVAHDLNNILSGVVSYPELILMDLTENDPLRKPLLSIQKSGERAVVIVQDLLTLARRGVVISEILNLNDVIAEQLENPEYKKLISLHPDIRVEVIFGEKLFNIKGSCTHLAKSIMNLISNAAEAMPDGGKIVISTENRYVDLPVSGYDHVAEGDYATMSIADSGIGIPTHDLEKIFEPFYTKKVMGRSGTGLGMAVVWGTVKDHNGYIEVESNEGRGTTFTLYFPATRDGVVSEDKPHLPIELYMGNGESILIVDDVEVQRDIASGMLKKLNYSVQTVSSGEDAVGYLKGNAADLLVLDMIMDPGIDGLETYRRILEFKPDQKAIIASGFTENELIKEVLCLGAGQYVKKPYTFEKIGLAVKKELLK